ncbi:hypothetical protein BDZ91DRAFT_746967 [Kalaharituber pfeilii]|nr:hypothetical protein BDZ91DRAFT_746967 [Kalaharituber pfeilii]
MDHSSYLFQQPLPVSSFSLLTSLPWYMHLCSGLSSFPPVSAASRFISMTRDVPHPWEAWYRQCEAWEANGMMGIPSDSRHRRIRQSWRESGIA